MIKPITFEEALLLVPTHWPLVPGVDRWRDGDETLEVGDIGQGREFFWDLVRPENFGKVVGECEARRPIPQDVRERMAKLILMIVESGMEMEASSAFPLETWILEGKP